MNAIYVICFGCANLLHIIVYVSSLVVTEVISIFANKQKRRINLRIVRSINFFFVLFVVRYS